MGCKSSTQTKETTTGTGQKQGPVRQQEEKGEEGTKSESEEKKGKEKEEVKDHVRVVPSERSSSDKASSLVSSQSGSEPKAAAKASTKPFKLSMIPMELLCPPEEGVEQEDGDDSEGKDSAKRFSEALQDPNTVSRALGALGYRASKSLLGVGGTAKVYGGVITKSRKAKSSGDVLGMVAVKEVPIAHGNGNEGQLLLRDLLKEHEAMSKLCVGCAHVVQVFHFEQDRNSASGKNTDTKDVLGQQQDRLGESEEGDGGVSITYARIYMELVQKGSLRKYVSSPSNPFREKNRLHELEARSYIRHALMGLSYLHKNKVLHRDIKPENMLLSAAFKWPNFLGGISSASSQDELLLRASAENKEENSNTREGVLLPCSETSGEANVMIKLSDFGTCKERVFGTISVTTVNVVGTVPFMSPQAVTGKFNESSEVWALGISFLSLLVPGGNVWEQVLKPKEGDGNYLTALMFKIGTLQPPNHAPPLPNYLSPQLKQVLTEGFFAYKPEQRLSAEQLLAHSYFKEKSPCPELVASMEALPWELKPQK